ncbi:S-ribosylhomocysteine lyase [Macrococcoides caseolyticum]|uniref:S-ribosylhomocysteine lyase n=1 Tax=Macrococcus psychrotolerans TaxID=3039389 RepID=A0AAU6RF89_9STAP|nr:S-ribosylhomocysteine lyase [Macrococcus sp. S115]MBQ5152175.1 S-ribosylhomocysteine lyase [Macrococcus caseolyticus]MDJ1112034.1 S-ribosylhomocysteine lyase [Macrococcus sp. S115]RKO16536.1 S-ribosylhomocysteine lyase [Macrococcus caseolyticus]
MTKKMNVESFNLDHTIVDAPFVRLAGIKEGINGDVIHKYDIRFKQPNKEHMEMPALHSLEHLMAENIRNHTDKVVDISPMGCQTGFYVSLINHDNYEDVLAILENTLNDVLAADEVPACNEVQCGWAASHSLEGAKAIAQEMLSKKDRWHVIYQPGKEPQA